MIYLPKELPELRTRMAEFSRCGLAPVMHEHHLEAVDTGVTPDALKSVAIVNALLDSRSFEDAALYFIQAEMVTLLMQAKDGIGETGFMEYDLPTPVGMAYLNADLPTWSAEPPAVSDEEWAALSEEVRGHYEYLQTHRAPARLLLLWRYMPPQEEYPNGWVRVAWYEDRDYVTAKMGLAWDDGEGGPLDTEKLRARLGPFVFDGHQVIACHPDASELKVSRYETDADVTWRTQRSDMFRALCYLLRQRVAEESTVMPDRAARRRMAREGKEPPPVRVISIRGGSAHGGGDGSREYVHRWVVRGHWRRQWYRSIQAHRPVWITPYVKGPEDAPLLGGEKVYSVAP
jgi:hypothetical protein